MFYHVLFSCIWTFTLPYFTHGISEYNSSFQTNTNANGSFPINVVVFAPEGEPYMFRKELIAPAVSYAITGIQNNLPSTLKHAAFNVIYRNSSCSRRAAVEAVNLYYSICKYNQTSKQCHLTVPTVFIGPVCNEATSVVATFAERWNIPIITTGARAAWVSPGNEYPTLTRMSASYIDLAFFIRNIFKRVQYGFEFPVHLVYEESDHTKTTERECYHLMQAVYAVFVRQEIPLAVEGPHVIDDNTNPDKFVQQIGNPKAVLMCASGEVIREIMLSASDAGIATKGENDWFVVDLHNETHYGPQAWKRGDDFDAHARIAYQALKIFSLRVSTLPKFENFSQSMIEEYERIGVPKSDQQVNGYIESFHDSVQLYVTALHQTILQNGSSIDGQAISANMRNITFEGIAGPVSLDSYGDRLGDYSLLKMTNYVSGTFSKILDFVGKELEISFHNTQDNFIDTMKEEAVVQNTLYESENLKKTLNDYVNSQKEQSSGLPIILWIAAVTVLCCLFVAGPICYKRKCASNRSMVREGIASTPYFNVNQQESIEMPLREGSMTTCMTAVDEDIKT